MKHKMNSNDDGISSPLEFISLFLIIILITFALYTWLSIQTTIVTIENPSIEQFELLPFDAQCPCSHISPSYADFTSIQVIFHQICSSDFISDRWIKAIYIDLYSTNFDVSNFQTYGSAQFQALAGFCRLSQSIVEQSIASFGLSTLISPKVLSRTVLNSQTESAINQSQLAATNSFRSQLQLVREVTRVNQLISGLTTNTAIHYSYGALAGFVYFSAAVYYVGIPYNTTCACDVDLDCKIPSYVPSHIIPGILFGCLPVNSILGSTLQCLYSQTCLNALIMFFPQAKNVSAMNVDEESRFNSNSTVKSMVDVLMVEKWMNKYLLR